MWEDIAPAVSSAGSAERNMESCKKRIRDWKRIIKGKVAAGQTTWEAREKKIYFSLEVAEEISGTSTEIRIFENVMKCVCYF